MSRERGQALIEVALAVPACIACAMAIVDCGIVVRDRMAVAQAAGRAASAQLAGGDVERAALAALPDSMREEAVVRVVDGQVQVRATSQARIARLAGREIVHRSSVEVAP